MKTPMAFAVLIFFTSSLVSQVGINRIDPEYTFDIRSNNNSEAAQLNISNQNKSNYLRIYSGSEMFPDPSFTIAPKRNLLFASFDDVSLAFNEYMRIDSFGNVGIGTTTPTQKLEIEGRIKISDDSSTPAIGTLRYNSAENRFEGFTNSGWKVLGQKNRKIVIGASSFSARWSSNYFNEGVYAYFSSGSGTTHYIYAPIIVPTGSRITRINYLYFDNDSSNDLRFNFYKSCGNSTTITQIDEHLVTGTAGTIIRNVTNSLSEVVGDNCQYFVNARAIANGNFLEGDWTSDLRFVKLYIEYEEQ